MNLPTPEVLKFYAESNATSPEVKAILDAFAALLRNPAVAMLLKLQEGGEGTPLTDANIHNVWTGVRRDFVDPDFARNLELCARAIEAATIERCAKVCADLSGPIETYNPSYQHYLKCAGHIRALPSMVAQSNDAKQSTPEKI